jgi:transcriptional regulator with XRE-family HTH domain
LARAAGVQPKTIINIERGRTQKIHMATMRKLAGALGVEARQVTEFREALGLDIEGKAAA